MAIKMVGKCKQCGADVHLDEDQEKGFCQYCGAEFIVDEKKSIIGEITSYLNKTGKRKAEQQIKQKQMEYEEEVRRHERIKENNKQLTLYLGGLMIVMFVIAMIAKALGM